MDWFYLCSGFAFLLTFEESVFFGRDRPLPYYLGICVREFIEMFTEMSVLLGLYFGLTRGPQVLTDYRKEITLVLFLALPYGLAQIQKRGGYFFLAVFAFCFWTVHIPEEAVYGDYLARALLMTVGFTVFRLLFSGLRRRIQFSSVPQSLAGLPVWLISAAVLAWACSGFFKLLI